MTDASSNRVDKLACPGYDPETQACMRRVCECEAADAIPNRAAHYCLTPGGWIECPEAMCQRHPACVQKRHAASNSVRDELIWADVDLTTGHAFAVENGLALGVLPEWYLRRLRARTSQSVAERWWVIHDASIRYALLRVESGEITKEEAYAILIENSTVDQIEGEAT